MSWKTEEKCPLCGGIVMEDNLPEAPGSGEGTYFFCSNWNVPNLKCPYEYTDGYKFR